MLHPVAELELNIGGGGGVDCQSLVLKSLVLKVFNRDIVQQLVHISVTIIQYSMDVKDALIYKTIYIYMLHTKGSCTKIWHCSNMKFPTADQPVDSFAS